MSNYPAQTVEDAYDACHPEDALTSDDPRYVELNEVRGGKVLAQTITKSIRRTHPPHFLKTLVAGHRGCGKSTELRRLETRLNQENFFAVFLDIEEVLDLNDVKYHDVLLAVAKEIEESLRQADIKIKPDLLKRLEDWFGQKTISSEQRNEIEAEMKTEAAMGHEIPFFAKLMASLTSRIKRGSTQREEIRRIVEQELTDFVDRLNVLIAAARTKIQEHGKKDLVVIVDGLEKMLYRKTSEQESNYTELYLHHSERLKAPACHLVFTVPISLVFSVNLGDVFPDGTFVIPMVNYQSDKGRRKLFEVVSKRVDVKTVFQSPSIVYELIKVSGGSIRDLMRLIRFACEGVDERITDEAGQNAIQDLVNTYDPLLKDEFLGAVAEVARTKHIDSDKSSFELLRLRLVLEYRNGGRWADIHPALRHLKRVEDEILKRGSDKSENP